MENIKLTPNSSVEREISAFHVQDILIASPAEQREWIKNMIKHNKMSMLEKFKKSMIAFIKEIDAAKEIIISEDEIEAFFDGVSKEEALRNIAASNASINEDDREWVRQILREQEA